MKYGLKIACLLSLSVVVMGCGRTGLGNPESGNAIIPSPTATRTLTVTSAPANTIEPTSTPFPTQTSTPHPPTEVKLQEIPLAGPIANPKAQISGMAWHGDDLIILPQYPEKDPARGSDPSLFLLAKNEIVDYLEGTTSDPLTPTRLSFLGGTFRSQIPGYEGYEAITITGDKVYLTIEANDRGRMAGYLVEGNYFPDQNALQIDPDSLVELPVPVQIFNYAYETLINVNDISLAIFEANGINLNPEPFAIRTINKSNEELGFSHIEYRITDATRLDENGRFWVTNIFMPIEFWLYTDSDPIFEKFGKGETHSANNYVERLLELQYNGDEIVLTDSEPIQLELDREFNSRNWEALAVLDGRGFLTMTDTYPETILAFIPFPNN